MNTDSIPSHPFITTEYYSPHVNNDDPLFVRQSIDPPDSMVNLANVSLIRDITFLGWAALDVGHFIADRVASASQSCAEVVHSFSHLGRALDSTKVLAVLGIITYIPTLVKSVKKAIRKPGWHRVDNSIRTVFCVRSMLSYFRTTVNGLNALNVSALLANVGLEATFKCVVSCTQYIGVINFILSPISLALNGRNYYRTRTYLDAFLEKARPFMDEKKELNKEEVDEFFKFLIEDTKDSALTRHFETNGAALKVALIAIQKSGDYSRMPELVGTLKGKAELGLFNYKAAIVADTVSIVATALILSTLSLPVGYILSAGVIATYIGILASRKIATYQFENKMGMIQRDEGSPFLNNTFLPANALAEKSEKIEVSDTVLDFTKWLFARHTYRKDTSPHIFSKPMENETPPVETIRTSPPILINGPQI